VEKIIVQTINDKIIIARKVLIARLMAQLKIQAQADEDTAEGKSDEHVGVQSYSAVDLGGKMSGSELQLAGLCSESSVSGIEACSIIHPYNGVNACTSSFLVMKDTGPTLYSLMLDAGFKDFWSRLAVREAFFQHVGQSALNLETLNLCHNDIRPPNITVKDDRFCLIDFDNCRQSPVFKNSPVMKSLGVESNSKRMMFSVAQIGIVVFKISMLIEEHGNVFRQVNQWLQGKGQEIPDKFETWVRAKSIERVFFARDEGRGRDLRQSIHGGNAALNPLVAMGARSHDARKQSSADFQH
jgi:hypothetical protein